MINAIGLANPGLAAVRAEHLPWLATHLARARVLVNVVGNTIDDFGTVVSSLTNEPAWPAFELNVSCPNVRCGGTEFGADPDVLRDLCHAHAARLDPPAVRETVADAARILRPRRRCQSAPGADAITVVNTLPGLVIDVETAGGPHSASGRAA